MLQVPLVQALPECEYTLLFKEEESQNSLCYFFLSGEVKVASAYQVLLLLCTFCCDESSHNKISYLNITLKVAQLLTLVLLLNSYSRLTYFSGPLKISVEIMTCIDL